MKPTIDVTILAYSEPGIAHNIRSWMPHAKKIIVVVGATSEASKAGAPPVDNITLAAVKSIADPNNQIVIINRSTYWEDKNEMAAAGSHAVSADLVWQVDADEYYRGDDIERARVELLDDQWSLAGMPHIMFWRDLNSVLRTRSGDDWFSPARIWRRTEGQTFLHFSTIQDQAGRTVSADMRHLDWGRCYHSSWCPPESRIAFKFAFHRARGDGPPQTWISNVWENGIVPPQGVHPGQDGIFPMPYDGPIPEALLDEAKTWPAGHRPKL